MSLEGELAFHLDVVEMAETLTDETGYSPASFIDLIARHGGPEAARRVLSVPITTVGFTRLWQQDRLDMSVEALALLPWYMNLFTQDQLDEARRRLEELGFNVDDHIRDALANPPTWWRHPQ